MKNSETPNREVEQMDSVFLIARNHCESKILLKGEKKRLYDLFAWAIQWSSGVRDIIAGALGLAEPGRQPAKSQKHQKT